MRPNVPITREVVLIGGGHTHTLFLRKWGMKPIPGVQISLISPTAETAYTGMLPGFLAGHYKREEINIDLVKLCRFSGVRFIIGTVENILTDNNLIIISGRNPISYDLASIDIGVTSQLLSPTLSSAYLNSIKPLADFADNWELFKARIFKKTVSPNVVIIGGGIGAVEIAMAIAYSFKKIGVIHYNISILGRSKALKEVRSRTRKKIMATLTSLSIKVLENVKASHATATQVLLHDNTEIASDFTIIAAGATPYDWLKKTNLRLNNGFIEIDRELRTLSHQNIFAVGDCSYMTFSPRPKAGVFAVRQASVLFANIRAQLLKRRLKKFSPQKSHLKLISLGSKNAVSDYALTSFSGLKVWNLKNYIDKLFMRQFSDFPAMKFNEKNHKIIQEISDKYSEEQMLCGGCGAKVGSDILEDILKNVETHQQKDILSGIGDDAAIINVERSKQVLTTDHLRSFTSDLWKFSTITAIHSLGDIWAMGGTPRTAMAQIIIPEASSKVQKGWLNEIMGAAQKVFSEEGTAIVGGHTSVGAEFNIGFSITGECQKKPILISGAQPGDILILTKPIGSGTILAGEMQLLSRGAWIEDALKWMQKSQTEASKILSKAHAMTDITGFGLAGHLMRMCEKSKVNAKLNISNVPFFDGAEELALIGVRSSIFRDNNNVKNKMSFVPSAKMNLLFDPQTSGGLLAAISKDTVDDVLVQLRSKNYCAALIGTLGAGAPFITVT